MKKLTALILIACLICASIPGAALAAPQRTIRIDPVTYVNPLYGDVLPQPRQTMPKLASAATAEAEIYYTTAQEVGQVIRSYMKQRQTDFQFGVAFQNYTEDGAHALMDEALTVALSHTGEPTEGDYLRWQFGSWTYGAEGYQQGSTVYLTFSYTREYYTTAAQEAQVDTTVDALLEDLSLADKTDYEKILSIYDYICANVTYDHAHVNDESYELQYTAYAALIDGTAVCQGYAVLLYRLALEEGIDSRLISGIGNGGPHGWNIVELEDLYYDVDATWDAGTTDYEYFLRCEANFPDHFRDAEYDDAAFHAAYPMSTTDYVPTVPCDHHYTAAVTAPTCTQSGYTTYTCTLCGDSYTGDEKNATGHTYGTWTETEAATCTLSGTQERICAACGTTETQTVSPLGHDYRDSYCTRCGQLEPGTVIAPAAPEILSCYSKVQTSVKVTWTTVDGADGYELWRSTTPDDPNSWTRAKSIMSGTTDRYTNQGLTVGVTYYYKVRAFALDGQERIYSDFSAVDHMPAAVVFDGPYSNATFRIRLRWQEVGGSHGYQVWRQETDGSWKIVKTLGDKGNTLTNDQGGTTAYSNTGLTAGKTYTYKMRAFRITDDGRKVFGAYSDEYTVAVMPETPTLTVTSPKAGRAKLSWNALNGAAGYQVWMSESPDTGFSIAKSVTDGSTTYTKYGLESGKTYYFKIRAYVEVDGKKTFGAYSQTIAVTIQ